MECYLGWGSSLQVTAQVVSHPLFLIPVVLERKPAEALLDSGSSISMVQLGLLGIGWA